MDPSKNLAVPWLALLLARSFCLRSCRCRCRSVVYDCDLPLRARSSAFNGEIVGARIVAENWTINRLIGGAVTHSCRHPFGLAHRQMQGRR